jgi:hypothetical protein
MTPASPIVAGKYFSNRMDQERRLKSYTKVKVATNPVIAFEFFRQAYLFTMIRAQAQIPTYGQLQANMKKLTSDNTRLCFYHNRFRNHKKLETSYRSLNCNALLG